MPNYLPVGGAERVSEPVDLDEGVPVSRFAVGGQADVAQMLRQVNEYNLYGDDPEYASESSGMLLSQGEPSRIAVKRVKGQELEPKTTKGFGKSMGMSLGPLAVGKGVKEGKAGGPNEDLLEVARRYKLRAKQAENEARGLMRDTFGAPTLEQPTLLRGPLMRKRFSEGGEVMSPEEQPVVEESSASRALREMMSPVREGVKGYFGMEPETVGSEAYRTGQALSNMPGAGVPATLGIFIGRGAKGWNKAMNDAAKRMSKQGATPEEVWQATGNFKGPDGMWRQEISDQAARINPSVSQGPLSMYLKHPELYENYPDLRQVLVRTNPDVRTSSYSPAGDDILIKSKDPERGVSSALHEVSHAIQTREGFAPGGSSLMAFKDPQAFDVLKEVRASMSTPTSKEVYLINAGWSPEDKGTKVFENSYKKYVKYIKDQSKTPEFDRLVQERAANVYYERLLGEAEARAVESRRLWTPEQRLQGIPSQSYERIGEPGGVIPLEKLIIKKSEGGDVSESRSYLDELGAKDDPIRSGKPLQRRTRRAATQEENEALNRAVLQGAANMPYNLVGAPVDLANMLLTPAGLGSERPVMGSDWIKQRMTDLGVRPEMPTDPTQRALYSAADIGSSLVNPAAPVRAAARGAEKAGEAARMLAEDFQQYNRQLAVPGASYAVRPEGTNLMIRREGNPDWVGGFLSDGVSDAKNQLELITSTPNREKLIEDFWNNKASNYFSKQFGTESDPIYRSIREQSLKSPGLAKDFPTYALDQLPVGKTRVNQETGESRFFPKYPEAWDAMREKYDRLTGITGAVPELNPSRVMDPTFTYSRTQEGRNALEALRDREIDRMIGQGTSATQANPNLEFLTRSIKDPKTIVGPYSAKSLLTDYEAATGTRIGDPDFRGVPTPEALPQNLRTAMEKGEIIYTTSSPDATIRNLFDTRAINEFLIGLPERELKNIRFEDAVKGGAKISAKRVARETLEADIRAGKRVPDKFFSEGVSAPLLQFKEGPLEGFAWKRIEKADATVPEGAYVGHSVGGYAQGGAYGPERHRQFNAGERQVYTLRDVRNRPVTTVEVVRDPEAGGPIVTQIKGNGRATGNTAPEKYDEAVLKFFQDYLKPVRIAENDIYLTPILEAYKSALSNM